ncbi:hypothetical protein ABLO27_04380 [Roseibium sp. SCPC15]|uniref:hypothetical protein n=1 Tax=Roseibium sp. SCP15 TaxID=3141376 RepID=UPI0033384B74
MHASTTSKNDLEIGAKLGAIIQDANSRAQLIEKPAEILGGVGINSDVTIFADTSDLVHLIIPANVDAERVAAGDDAYFEELGRAALGSCYYEDIPE